MLLKKGITLIEVLTVVAIVSILFSTSYLYYKQYVRKGYQLEARTNLGIVYQKQITYLSSELKFSNSLKTIGAVPFGRIRYNIGTDWDGGGNEQRLNQGNPTRDLCRCHNDQRGRNIPTYPCWADPKPESSTGSCSSSNKCYGDAGSPMFRQLSNSGVTPPTNLFNVDKRKFEYYAIGCTSIGRMQSSQLDIWSINHKKSLKNIRQGF